MKITEIKGNKITFDNGTTITDYHEQDCCEQVYAAFETLEDTGILDYNFTEIVFEGVPKFGVRINGYSLPCYDRQNGCYSFDLTLIVKDKIPCLPAGAFIF